MNKQDSGLGDAASFATEDVTSIEDNEEETHQNASQGDSEEISEESGEASGSQVESDSDDSEPSEENDTESEAVRTRPTILMYVEEELKEELKATKRQLAQPFYEEHGREMELNRDLYPAVLQAGLKNQPLKEVLGLE